MGPREQGKALPVWWHSSLMKDLTLLLCDRISAFYESLAVLQQHAKITLKKKNNSNWFEASAYNYDPPNFIDLKTPSGGKTTRQHWKPVCLGFYSTQAAWRRTT